MSFAEKSKKVLSFIFLTSTINRRNTTSLGLVILFMIVYALSGGKIFWAPKIRGGEGFGSVQSAPGSKSLNLSGDVVKGDSSAKKATGKKSELFNESSKPATSDTPASTGGSSSLSELQQRLNKLNVDKRKQ